MDIGLGAGLHPSYVGLARLLEALSPEGVVLSRGTLSASLPRVSEDCPFAYDDDHESVRVYRVEGAQVLLTWYSQSAELQVQVFAENAARGEEVLHSVLGMVEPRPEQDEAVSVTFWAWSERWGAQPRRRSLEAGLWASMAWNYPRATRVDLEALMEWQGGPGFGQLLLLYGPPGTGKTHAIRALAQAWRSWSEVSYVTDPERFFGSSDYMLSVLLDGAPEAEDRWQLVVVEDTDELIRADARQRSGQAVSRLLNLCDGLIGQGLRVLVLLTTNEPVDALHPAITRPGRCAARIEAGLFSPEEARAWLRAHEITETPEEPCSLADLFSRLRQRSLAGSARPIGHYPTWPRPAAPNPA